MARRTYQQKWDNVLAWNEITTYHWERLKGKFFDDLEAWDQTFHQRTDQDWWDWVDVMKVLELQYPELVQRYPGLLRDTKDIEKRLMNGKPVLKPNQKNYNHPVFASWMKGKDLLNDILGTPTKEFPKDPPPPEDDNPTPFGRLFDIK